MNKQQNVEFKEVLPEDAKPGPLEDAINKATAQLDELKSKLRMQAMDAEAKQRRKEAEARHEKEQRMMSIAAFDAVQPFKATLDAMYGNRMSEDIKGFLAVVLLLTPHPPNANPANHPTVKKLAAYLRYLEAEKKT